MVLDTGFGYQKKKIMVLDTGFGYQKKNYGFGYRFWIPKWAWILMDMVSSGYQNRYPSLHKQVDLWPLRIHIITFFPKNSLKGDIFSIRSYHYRIGTPPWRYIPLVFWKSRNSNWWELNFQKKVSTSSFGRNSRQKWGTCSDTTWYDFPRMSTGISLSTCSIGSDKSAFVSLKSRMTWKSMCWRISHNYVIKN